MQYPCLHSLTEAPTTTRHFHCVFTVLTWGRIDGILSNANTRIPTELPTTKRLDEVRTIGRCPRCGIVQASGKRSCCARGGTWFNKCGNADDAEFEHTWVDGVEACRGFKSVVLAKSSVQGVLRQGGFIANVKNTSQHIALMISSSGMPNEGEDAGTSSTARVELVKEVAAYVCVLCLVLHSQVY